MTDARIEEVVSTATAGLDVDPEVRLDVQQELRTHIEETARALQAEGMSDIESVEQALRAFGSPADVAADLLNANRGRMRLHAWLRLVVRALLVPAAVAVAFVVFLDMWQSGGGAFLLSQLTGIRVPGPVRNADSVRILARQGLSPQAQFLFFGDKPGSSGVEVQRALLDSDPTNRVFYGCYVTALLGDGTAEDKVERTLAALPRGEALDPDNARYNYLRAGLLLEQACELVDKQDGSDGHELVVRDRDLLDRAMQEVVKAQAKPYLKSYSGEMLRMRLDALPPARHFEERIARIGHAAGQLLPGLARYRQIGRVCPLYARTLVREGRADEALPVLRTWYALSTALIEDAYSLIEVLVGFAIISQGEQAAAVMAESGHAAAASEMRERVSRLRAPVDAWKARREGIGEDEEDAMMKHGGVLQRMLLPALGERMDAEALAPGRFLEHTMLEEVALTIFLLVFVLLMAGMLLIALFSRPSRAARSAPLLLVPRGMGLVRILLAGVMAPLAIFFVYTRVSGMAGREYGLSEIGQRFALELGVLGFAMLYISVYLSARFVRQRAEELGIDVPAKVCPGVVAASSLVPVGLFVWLTVGKRERTLYKSSLARSLIPVFACVIILVGGLAHPYLSVREATYLQADPLIASESGAAGFTAAETRLVNRLKGEVRAIIAGLDADSALSSPGE